MARLNLVPISSSDDGYVDGTELPLLGVFRNTSYSLYWGNAGTSIHSYIRFPNATIPKGATIEDVSIYRAPGFSNLDTTANISLYFNNVDNATAPTTVAEFNALALTSGLGVGNLPGESKDVPGYLYQDLGDGYLAAILQEVIDRAGWESGNAIMLIIKDDSSSFGALRGSYAVDYNGGAAPLRLEVEYTEPPGPFIGEKYPLPPFKIG